MKVYSLIGSRGVGSVGELTLQKWKDKTVARTKPVSVENPQTEAQQTQRQKFSLLVAASRTLAAVITIGFKQISNSMTTFNSFVKYNIASAITGTYPNFSIEYEFLQLSRGSALPLTDVAVAVGLSGLYRVTWDQPAGSPVPADSMLYLVALNPATGDLLYFASAPMDNTVIEFPGSADVAANSSLFKYVFYVNSANGATSDSVWFDAF